MQPNHQPIDFEVAPVKKGCTGCWFRHNYTCCDINEAVARELDAQHGICHLEKHIYKLKEVKK